MTSEAVCAQPDRDPNDWYLDLHGQQYGDDAWLTEEDKERLLADLAERTREELTHLQQISEIARAEAKAKREALIRRRRAREACYECPLRVECLTGAMERRETTGTWGGLYQEELEKTRRMKRRRERSTINATEEQPRQVAQLAS